MCFCWAGPLSVTGFLLPGISLTFPYLFLFAILVCLKRIIVILRQIKYLLGSISCFQHRTEEDYEKTYENRLMKSIKKKKRCDKWILISWFCCSFMQIVMNDAVGIFFPFILYKMQKKKTSRCKATDILERASCILIFPWQFKDLFIYFSFINSSRKGYFCFDVCY